MTVDTKLFEALHELMKRSSSFTISPMKSRDSGDLRERLVLLLESGTENYILKYRKLTPGFTWFNILPDAKDGTVSPPTA